MKKLMMLLLSLPFILKAANSDWQHLGNFLSIKRMMVHQNELWIAGHGGLARVPTNQPNPTVGFIDKSDGLPSLAVEEVTVHPITGDIWIGTYDNGIARQNGNLWETIALPDTAELLFRFKFDPAGNAWVLTNRGKLWQRAGNQWQQHLRLQSIDDFFFRADGKMICTNYGTPSIYDPQSNVLIILNKNLSSSNAYVFPLDGNRWMLTDFRQGCLLYDDTNAVRYINLSRVYDVRMAGGKILAFQPRLTDVTDVYVSACYLISDSSMVSVDQSNFYAEAVCTEGQVIYTASAGSFGEIRLIDPSGAATFASLRRENMIEHRFLQKLRVLESDELLVMSRDRIQSFNLANAEFNEPMTYSITGLTDAIRFQGKLYAGTSSRGLYMQNSNGLWEIAGAADAQCLATDNHGLLWIGGSANCIYSWDGQNMVTHNFTGSIRVYVRELLYDTLRQTLWAATSQGLMEFKNGQSRFWNEQTHPELSTGGLSSNDFLNIAMGSDGIIWLSSSSKLVSYDGTRFYLEAYGSGITDLSVTSDAVYISTSEYGITKLQNGVRSSFTSRNSGLSGNEVLSVVADRQGNLWAANSMGLDVYKSGGIALQSREVQSLNIASVYPNPFSDQLHISSVPGRSIRAELWSIEGRKLSETVLPTGSDALSLQHLATGMYLLRIESGGEFQSLRIVKK